MILKMSKTHLDSSSRPLGALWHQVKTIKIQFCSQGIDLVQDITSDTRLWADVGLMLARCQQRLSNIKPSLAQRCVIAQRVCVVVRETSQQAQYVGPMLIQCWSTVYDACPPLAQHRANLLCLLRLV